MTDTVLIVGDDGEPLYFLDAELIRSEGGRLAVQLAAVAGNPTEIDRVTRETLDRVGGGAFGHVAASALAIMATKLLGPALDIASGAIGLDMRKQLQRIHHDGHPTST